VATGMAFRHWKKKNVLETRDVNTRLNGRLELEDPCNEKAQT
jgi:hypothetical protein